MYPLLRLQWQIWKHRRDPALPLLATHVSRHLCWPWDIDPWMELNNGRTLTLYDLGRIVMARRIGLHAVLRAQGWGMAIAGASVRYRRRIRAFDRITMTSRALCWDDRFLYAEQAMWKADGECASHALFRSAVTDSRGIVPTAQVLAAMGHTGPAPAPPAWAAAWIAAEALRPWPPMPGPAG